MATACNVDDGFEHSRGFASMAARGREENIKTIYVATRSTLGSGLSHRANVFI